MAPEKLPVFLVEDSPATEDAFGTHERVADAILQLVTKEPGGKAIALVGGWGSGKSTVVGLLQRAAQNSSTTGSVNQPEVFIFDAWAHEGDPLRRSFLERLIVALQRRGWVERKTWDTKLAEISKRRRVVQSTSSPVLDTWGLVLLLFLYIAPAALVLISSYHWFWHKWRILAVGLSLYALPLILAIVHWIKHSAEGDVRGKFDLVGLMSSKTVQRTETETFVSPDPTSVEFQQVFRELAAEALDVKSHPTRKLLLIIDNLDRVDPEDALRLWASMSTFLDYPTSDSADWAKQLWTLVPFDDVGIKRLWEGKEAQHIGETFLAKTFQIRFRVPAPVLSDWTSFLKEQLRKAFPKHDEREFYNISRIFFILRGGTQPPTPRDIKNFVNQVGATYRSYPESVPLALHALFAALTHDGKDWKAGEKVPAEKELEPYVGSDSSQSLAAIYFNVPRDKALQVLFGADVEKYLTEGDSTKLGALAKKPGLDHVILQVVGQKLPSWIKNEPFRIGRAAFACNGAGDQTTLHWEEIWNRLEMGSREATTWPLLDEQSGAGIAILIQRRKEPEFTKAILGKLSAPEKPGIAPGLEHTEKWLAGTLEIVNGVIQSGQTSVLAESLRFGNTPQEYLSLLGAVRSLSRRRDLVRYIRPGRTPNEIVDTLVNAASVGTFASVESASEAMLEIEVPWDWSRLVTAIQPRLQQPNIPCQEASAFIRTLLRMPKAMQNATEVLRVFTQTGWIFHFLQVSIQNNHSESIASCLLAVILFEPEAAGTSSPYSAAQGRQAYRNRMLNIRQTSEVFRALVAQAGDLVSVEELLVVQDKSTIPKSALREVLKELTSGPNRQRIFGPNVIIEEYQRLRSVFDQADLSRLLSQSVSSGELLPHIVKTPFSEKNAGMYRAVLNSTKARELQEYLIKGLQSISKEVWFESLQHGGELAFALFDLEALGVTLALEFPFQDALSDFADQALAGTAPKLTPEQCAQLLDALSEDQREIFKRHIAEEIADASHDIKEAIKYFGRAIECAYLVEVADKLVREGFPRILQRMDTVELNWMKNILKQCGEVLEMCNASSLKTLKARIDKKLEEEPTKETKSILHEIANSLGIKSS